MRNIKLTIEYDGKEYNGWQKQPNKLNIQGEIEKAIENVTGEQVNLIGSGRTDAGVNAFGQVANFKTNSQIPIEKFAIAINSRLKKFFKVFIVVGAVIAIFGAENIFNMLNSLKIMNLSRYQHYFSDTDVGGRFIRIIYWGVVTYLVIIQKKKLSLIELGKYRIFIWMCYLSLILSFLSFIVSAWAIRIAFFFDIGQVITIPLIENCISFRIGNKKMNGFILALIPFLYWLITFIVRNGAATFPYVFMRS